MRPVVLENATCRATIVPEIGGRLHQLEIFDGVEWLELLYSPDDPAAAAAQPLGSGSFPMAPWPNRIARGELSWNGRVLELPRNFGGHAIHGSTFARPWTLEDANETRCQMSIDLGDDWPWRGRAMQDVTLDGNTLRLTIAVHSEAEPFPAGAGWHPYFRRDVRRGRDPQICIDADDAYETHDMIPTGAVLPVQGDIDFRTFPRVGARRVDVCYQRPRMPLRVRWGDVEVAIDGSESITHAVVFTAGHAICVEPQTCAIDAFNLEHRGATDTGTVIVEPGRPLVATSVWQWTCDRAASRGA